MFRSLALLVRLGLCLAAVSVVSGCASSGPPRLPPGIDPAHVHFWEPAVGVGDPAPDFTLPRADGSGDLTLSSLGASAGTGGRPVVLIFGSYT